MTETAHRQATIAYGNYLLGVEEFTALRKPSPAEVRSPRAATRGGAGILAGYEQAAAIQPP